jgi:hypothetical protein
MPVQQFSLVTDERYIRRRDAEKHRLYYTPRRWLIHTDTLETNIYGEPGPAPTSIAGTDGVTSAPATRTLTSATVNFATAGVQVSDILEVFNTPCDTATSTGGDNGRFTIDNVSTNTVTINQNWAVGNQDALDFRVHFLKERFIPFEQLVPFLVKLNPTEKALEKWGIDERRDCMIEMSAEVLAEINLQPKIGDRFIYPYSAVNGESRNIHYEVRNLFEADQLGDSTVPFHYIGFAMRTTNKLP